MNIMVNLVATILFCLAYLVNQNGGHYIKDERFMSDVNLEHYYVIEENALSNADVLLREDYFGADEEEDEETHLEHMPNLTQFKGIIDEAKMVHQLAGPDLEAFLWNPVNMYHLLRRLDDGWRQGLDLLLQTKPCRHWNLPSMVGRLHYLQDNLPGRLELERVVGYIATLQKIYKLNPQDIAKGRIGDGVSVKPLNIEEEFQIVKVLNDKDDMETALVWLQHIYNLLAKYNPSQREELSFKLTDVLNLMASANYHMKDISEALKLTEAVLKLDASNGIALSNLRFFKSKLAALEEKGEDTSKKAPSRKMSKFERLCARQRKQKVSRKKCTLLRYGYWHFKKELIRRKPYIALFHDVLRNTTATHLKNYAYNVLSDNAWEKEEKFHPPTLSLKLDPVKLRVNQARWHVNRLHRYLSFLALADQRQLSWWGQKQIINVGLEGMHLENHKEKLRLVREYNLGKISEVAPYFTFLNDVKKGGEVVFTDQGITLHPEKGSVLFYSPVETKIHSFCPVVGGSLWVAINPSHEKKKDFCVAADEWDN
ncbi:unnamed protein product [Lymnaea stagnalis]|uniref:Prolyl 4-hydroxylase alpha subunit domain-containing protein n=1 Tax=Lymnaea stagnalis TaxID=6523 RepID=A0AAV2HTP3_LYMST